MLFKLSISHIENLHQMNMSVTGKHLTTVKHPEAVIIGKRFLYDLGWGC